MKLKYLPSLVLLCAVIGLGMTCSRGRGTYTTLASTEQAAVLAYDGYLDSVIKGQTRTNDLPIVSHSFDAFQALMRAAVDKASGNTNAPVTGDVSTSLANLINTINNSKAKK